MATGTQGDRASGKALAEEALAGALAERIWLISRRLRRAARASLAPLGLSDGQARVLRMLDRHGAPLRMSDIARRIEVVPRAATTVVESLEAKGLVTREIDPGDRRSILVRPTTDGAGILGELAKARDEAAAALFGRASAEQRAELLRLLWILLPPEEGEAATEGGPLR